MQLETQELMMIRGGSSVTLVSFINSMVRALSTFKDLGNTLGSTLKRFIQGRFC